MKRRLVHSVVVAGLLLEGAASHAQAPADDTIPVPVPQLLKVSSPKLYHVSLNYSMGLNIKATFQDVRAFSASNPGAATGGVNHHYDDGYNLVDVTGNNHGGVHGTWNWGYNNASQISGNSVQMNSDAWGSGTASTASPDRPQPGMELVFGRELGRGKHVRWGLDGTFGFTDVRIQNNGPMNVNKTRTTDSYDLNGTIPPAAPYNGTLNGPGPIISDTPTRTTSVVDAGIVSGPRELDAQLYSFKLGPYVEVPLNKRWALQFRGGLALVEVASQFSFNETLTTSAGFQFSSAAEASQNGLQIGGYAAVNLSYALSDSVGLFAGGQFEDVGQYTQDLKGRKAVLDLTRSIFVAVGLSYSY